MRGKGTYSELFSDGSGNRYLSGLQGQINVKQDGQRLCQCAARDQ